MGLTELVHGVNPVCVLVEVVVVHRTALVVVQLHHVTCGTTLTGVEIGLLHHHGIAVTVKHVQTLGGPLASEAVREIDFRLTGRTTTGGDLNHTVGTARTPDGGSGGVLQHVDVLDVLGVHRQKGSELLLIVQVFEVHLRYVGRKVEDVAIDHNQWLGATVDGAHTTKTHAGTRTQVT